MNKSILVKKSGGLFYVCKKENKNIKRQLIKIKQYDICN